MRANRLGWMLWGAVLVAGNAMSGAANEPALRSVVVNSKARGHDAASLADDEPAPQPAGRWEVEPRGGHKPAWRSPQQFTARLETSRGSAQITAYPVRRAAHAAPAEVLPPGKAIEPRPDRVSIGDPADGEVIYEGAQDEIFGDELGEGEAYYGGPPAGHRRRLPHGHVVHGFDGYDGPADDEYGGDCSGGDDCCDSDCCWRVRYCIDWCVFGPYLWEHTTLIGGVHAFKGPVDRGTNGNFGFHEGFNWTVPIGERLGLGFQLGALAVHSNLSGTQTDADSRTQYFVTSGLFRRAPGGWGLQGGAVVDYQHDDFLVSTELAQVRAQLSLLFCCRHELGVWIAAHSADDRAQVLREQRTITRQTTDIYAGFYRHYLHCGGDVRAWGGATGDGEGILGADAELPLCRRWSLTTAFNYRIPNEDSQQANARQESWGVSISLVWYPFRRDCSPAPFRPLFPVADNTTFFVNQQ